MKSVLTGNHWLNGNVLRVKKILVGEGICQMLVGSKHLRGLEVKKVIELIQYDYSHKSGTKGYKKIF